MFRERRNRSWPQRTSASVAQRLPRVLGHARVPRAEPQNGKGVPQNFAVTVIMTMVRPNR